MTSLEWFAEAEKTNRFKRVWVKPTLGLIPVCAYEGRVVTGCSIGDVGHWRQCLHPKAEWDLCRRDAAPATGQQRCSTCPLHSRHEIGHTRHLLYFICPIGRNGVWQWNVEQLLRRIDLFNGRRVIAIATGRAIQRPRIRPRPLDPPEQVQAMFPPGCEFLTFTNKPELGECVAWEALWAKVLPGQPGDVTFYGHAKGVGKPTHPTVRKWTQCMYETCLDDWPAVQEQLRQFPVTGSFKKTGNCFPETVPASRFHYSGTFYWVRNADWHERGGYKAYPTNMTSEAMPGVCFRPEEAGALLCTGFGTAMNLYSEMTWRTVIEPKYRDWRLAHGRDTIAAAQTVGA